LHHKIVLIIFPKRYFKIERVLKQLNYPLSSFKGSKIKKDVKELYTRIVKEFKLKIGYWKRLKHVRGLIEDWKYVAINALLAGLIILQGYNSKEGIQRLSEW